MENKKFDPAGIINLDELNEISEINGGLIIEGASAIIMTATVGVAAVTVVTTMVTAHFSCGGIGCHNCGPCE